MKALVGWKNSFHMKNHDMKNSSFPNFLSPRGTQRAINHLSRGSGSPARADRLISALDLAFFRAFLRYLENAVISIWLDLQGSNFEG